MTYTLQITDGTTTVQLELAGSRRALYTPRTAERDKRELRMESDGGELPRVLYRNVDDQAEVWFTSQHDLRAVKDQLDRLFEVARQRQSMPFLPRVYVLYDPDTADATGIYRSEILTGSADPGNREWTQLVVRFTRRYYWEADTELQLSMSNDVSGSDTTQTLYNHNRNANSRNNWVRVSGILGQLASPARIRLFNNYASGTRTENFWIGQTVESGSKFVGQHLIEIESGTYYNGGSTINDSASSNNAYGNLVWNGTNEMTIWSAQLTSTMLGAARGNWFRALARVVSASHSDIRLKARVSVDLITTLWEGAWVTPSAFGDMLDLGVLQLPSWLLVSGNIYPLTFELRARRNAGGSPYVRIDYVQFMPLMSWLNLRSIGYNIAQNVSLNYDPYDDQIYTDGWSGGRVANYITIGGPILLQPGYTNVIHFAWTPVDTVLRSTQVQLWYRPRRLTI